MAPFAVPHRIRATSLCSGMNDPGGIRNLENLQEDDDERRMPPGVTLTLLALGGACIVFGAFALGGRLSQSPASKADLLGDLVSRHGSLPAAATSTRVTVDSAPRDVTFPQMLSDDDRPSTALAGVRMGASPASLEAPPTAPPPSRPRPRTGCRSSRSRRSPCSKPRPS